MVREIKFRGKRVNDGRWVYGSLLQSEIAVNGHCKCAICERFADGYNIREHDVVPESVGQFTGVIDKNEKEIYEGDIIFDGHEITSKVFYDSGSFMTHIENRDRGAYLEISQNSFTHKFEIVGSIHESNTVKQ